MSLERIIKTLIEFGLIRSEAEIYVYLAKKGPHKANSLASSLNIKKQQLYLCLKRLRKKKIITVSKGRPAIFSAMKFEKVLFMLIAKKIEQSKEIQKQKKEKLTIWHSIDWENNV